MNYLKYFIPLIAVAILVIPYLAIKKINLKNRFRYKQIRFIPISLLYSIVCILLVNYLKNIFANILNIGIVNDFVGLIAPTGKLSYVITIFLALLINSGLLFAFVIIKGIAKIGMKRIQLPEEFSKLEGLKKYYWLFINWFYSIDDKSCYIRNNFIKIKHTIKYFIRILNITYLFLTVIIQIPIFWSGDWIPYDFMQRFVSVMYVWPVLSILILSEIYYFLDGREKHDSTGKIAYEKTEEEIEADYAELIKAYTEDNDRIKTRFVTNMIARSGEKSKNMINDASTDNPLAESIKKRLIGNGIEINENYLNNLENIINGKDVIVDSSVFSEFGEYLFSYLNTLIAHGENILFICVDEQQVEQVKEYVYQQFKQINSYSPIWRIQTEKEANSLEEKDILITTPNFVNNGLIFEGQKAFFNLLTKVIVINANEIMARDGVLLSLISMKLSNIVKKRMMESNKLSKPIQYICLSESIPSGTKNALTEALNIKDSIAPFDAYKVFDKTHILFWKFEDPNTPFAQDAIFINKVNSFWGVAIPLACIAIRYGVEVISIISQYNSPYKQIMESMSVNYNKIKDYFDKSNSDIIFEKRIIFNKYNFENEYSSFAIIEDELFNLPLAIYNSRRFGGSKTTMIHIVSKNYMLRDYFLANVKRYIDDESGINMFMPNVEDCIRISVYRILFEMSESGLAEDIIISRVSELTMGIEDITDALQFCLKIALEEELKVSVYNYFSFKEKSEFDNEEGKYLKKYYVYLRNIKIIDKLLKHSKPVKFEIRGYKYTTKLSADRIFQNHLKGQILIYNGNSYQIEKIDQDNAVIHLKNGPENIDVPTGYNQIREYCLDNSNSQIVKTIKYNFDSVWDEVAMIESYIISQLRVPLTVKTTGYYIIEKTGDPINFMESQRWIYLDDEEQKSVKREYKAANALSIKFKGKYITDKDKATFLLAVILSEFMKTMFPYSYNCIAVCPVLNDPETITNDEFGKGIYSIYPQLNYAEKKENNDGIEILFIEDSMSDVGVVKMMIQNRNEIFETIFRNIKDYLKWLNEYKEEGDLNIRKNYLYFGKESFPECFDVEMLTKLFNEINLPQRVLPPEDKSNITSKGLCSFCGSEIVASEYVKLSDGRMMCDRCRKLIVREEKELGKLFDEAVDYLNKEFNVSISDNIKVRFATAKSIRMRMNKGEEREVLGFASSYDRELWVETNSPAINLSHVIAHELTHFWQFDNISCKDKDYIEGHASYVEIQYLRYLKQEAWADYWEDGLNRRDDEYGRGFRLIKEKLDERGDLNSFTYMQELFGNQ